MGSVEDGMVVVVVARSLRLGPAGLIPNLTRGAEGCTWNFESARRSKIHRVNHNQQGDDPKPNRVPVPLGKNVGEDQRKHEDQHPGGKPGGNGITRKISVAPAAHAGAKREPAAKNRDHDVQTQVE